MAFYSDVHGSNQNAIERIFTRSADLFATFIETVKRRRIARATYMELAALSDGELADLGIVRSEIRRISLEASAGKL